MHLRVLEDDEELGEVLLEIRSVVFDAFDRQFSHDDWEHTVGGSRVVPSYVRDAGRLIRTADEDDGLMVLRYGPKAEIDLRSRIACEARQGDDW